MNFNTCMGGRGNPQHVYTRIVSQDLTDKPSDSIMFLEKNPIPSMNLFVNNLLVRGPGLIASTIGAQVYQVVP